MWQSLNTKPHQVSVTTSHTGTHNSNVFPCFTTDTIFSHQFLPKMTVNMWSVISLSSNTHKSFNCETSIHTVNSRYCVTCTYGLGHYIMYHSSQRVITLTSHYISISVSHVKVMHCCKYDTHLHLYFLSTVWMHILIYKHWQSEYQPTFLVTWQCCNNKVQGMNDYTYLLQSIYITCKVKCGTLLFHSPVCFHDCMAYVSINCSVISYLTRRHYASIKNINYYSKFKNCRQGLSWNSGTL